MQVKLELDLFFMSNGKNNQPINKMERMKVKYTKLKLIVVQIIPSYLD